MLDDWELWCGLSGILVVTPFLVWLQGSSLESHLCTSWINRIYIYICIYWLIYQSLNIPQHHVCRLSEHIVSSLFICTSNNSSSPLAISRSFSCPLKVNSWPPVVVLSTPPPPSLASRWLSLQALIPYAPYAELYLGSTGIQVLIPVIHH